MKQLSMSEIDKQNAKTAENLKRLNTEMDRLRETININENLGPENFETYEGYQNSRHQYNEAKQQLAYKAAQLKKAQEVTPEQIQEILYSLERERDEVIKRNLPELLKSVDKLALTMKKIKEADAQISKRYEVYRNLHTAPHFPAESNLFFMNNRLLRIDKFCEGFYYDPIHGEHYKRPTANN